MVVVASLFRLRLDADREATGGEFFCLFMTSDCLFGFCDSVLRSFSFFRVGHIQLIKYSAIRVFFPDQTELKLTGCNDIFGS